MAYYIETNLTAIVVAIALLVASRKTSGKMETAQLIMNCMLGLLVLLGLSDIAAYFFRGKSYAGVQTANILYLVAMALGAYAWFLYVIVKLGYAKNLRNAILKTCAPLVVLCTAIFLNPLTGFSSLWTTSCSTIAVRALWSPG